MTGTRTQVEGLPSLPCLQVVVRLYQHHRLGSAFETLCVSVYTGLPPSLAALERGELLRCSQVEYGYDYAVPY